MENRQKIARADLAKEIQTSVAQFRNGVESELPKLLETCGEDAQGFRRLELRISELAREEADGIAGAALQALTKDRQLEGRAVSKLRASGAFRRAERKEVAVTLLGGGSIRVKSAYVRRDISGRRGRRRGSGKRGKTGTGHYPMLGLLGVFQGVTPAAMDEIVRQVAESDAVRSGRASLARRGLDLGHKQTLRIFNGASKRAVAFRDSWLQAAAAGPPTRGSLRRRRVVITTDGGRIRERLPAKCGRRNKKTRHRRFEAVWREPKLVVIYVIDDDGEVLQSFRPVYDGTMGDADQVFEMLVGYLKALGAHEAKELIVVGDGAIWIWDRADTLAERVGIAADKVKQIIDWYHAVETLGKIAKCRAKWGAPERETWIKATKKALYRGDIDAVVARIDKLGVGRGAKDIRKHREYFAKNADRMQYEKFRKLNIPIGSGAVESAVRRVVNMRMKGNARFWLEENAEGMLLMRSYLKAGRLDDLFEWVHARSVQWWDETTNSEGPISDLATAC